MAVNNPIGKLMEMHQCNLKNSPGIVIETMLKKNLIRTFLVESFWVLCSLLPDQLKLIFHQSYKHESLLNLILNYINSKKADLEW